MVTQYASFTVFLSFSLSLCTSCQVIKQVSVINIALEEVSRKMMDVINFTQKIRLDVIWPHNVFSPNTHAGSFPVLSLMVGAVVTRLVPDSGPPANITGFEDLTMDQQRVLVASSMTFLVGIFQVVLVA